MLVFSTHAFTEGDTVEYLNGFLMDFSTHAFTEGDGEWGEVAGLILNSQLTPSRKATTSSIFRRGIDVHSQLTPSRKATWLVDINNSCFSFLNSRLHGRRPVRAGTISYAGSSQLTPSRKATLFAAQIECQAAFLNSRLHGRRRILSVEPFLQDDFSTHAFTEGDCKFK